MFKDLLGLNCLDLPERPEEVHLRKGIKVLPRYTLKLLTIASDSIATLVVEPTSYLTIEYQGNDNERTLVRIVKNGIKTETLYGRLIMNSVEYVPTLVVKGRSGKWLPDTVAKNRKEIYI